MWNDELFALRWLLQEAFHIPICIPHTSRRTRQGEILWEDKIKGGLEG